MPHRQYRHYRHQDYLRDLELFASNAIRAVRLLSDDLTPDEAKNLIDVIEQNWEYLQQMKRLCM